MLRSLDSGISGLQAHQTMLDVTANNIANVNTIGYKASRATFADSLAQTEIGASAPDVLDSRSHLYPDSLRTMGYDVGTEGFDRFGALPDHRP